MRSTIDEGGMPALFRPTRHMPIQGLFYAFQCSVRVFPGFTPLRANSLSVFLWPVLFLCCHLSYQKLGLSSLSRGRWRRGKGCQRHSQRRCGRFADGCKLQGQKASVVGKIKGDSDSKPQRVALLLTAVCFNCGHWRRITRFGLLQRFEGDGAIGRVHCHFVFVCGHHLHPF